MYKTCPQCNVHKKLDDFHKQKSGSYGRHSICKLCRSLSRKTLNNEIRCKTKICNLCEIKLNTNMFYKNKSSKDGLQVYCKKCQVKKISKSKSKLNNFSKLILNKYIKKHQNLRIKVGANDIMRKFNEQNGKCFITKHQMTHEADLKQRTDNIWNMAMLVDDDAKTLDYDNFNLVIHLIYTTKELYNMSLSNVKDIYKKLL
jgi:hypothetical protein